MTQPTKEEWMAIESLVVNSWERVVLKVDGYRLGLNTSRHGMRLKIMVWVNGATKGVWMAEDCEERRRFYQCSKRYLFSAAERRACAKLYGKVSARKSKICQPYYSYSPLWTSFAALRRHLVKHNQDIVWERSPSRSAHESA